MSGGSREELEERTERVKALCASMLLHVVPATFRAFDGWLTTLPLGIDRLRLLRTFDTPGARGRLPVRVVGPAA